MSHGGSPTRPATAAGPAPLLTLHAQTPQQACKMWTASTPHSSCSNIPHFTVSPSCIPVAAVRLPRASRALRTVQSPSCSVTDALTSSSPHQTVLEPAPSWGGAGPALALPPHAATAELQSARGGCPLHACSSVVFRRRGPRPRSSIQEAPQPQAHIQLTSRLLYILDGNPGKPSHAI